MTEELMHHKLLLGLLKCFVPAGAPCWQSKESKTPIHAIGGKSIASGGTIAHLHPPMATPLGDVTRALLRLERTMNLLCH